MMLRRAGSLGNAAVAISRQLLGSKPDVQSLSVVTVSEFGELENNDALIESVVAGRAVSPQKFAASVHNHILGQVCINLGLPCRGGASTGCNGSLEIGLIEALSELDSAKRVLVLIFEPEIDHHYANWCGGPAPEHMVGVVLNKDAPSSVLLERKSDYSQGNLTFPRTLEWLSFITRKADTFIGNNGWYWSHVDA
ncbi:MAG: hypothetical protein DHS20C01_24840 [marine bacterium B5-7]|nr:MAG: hypothetical protein DHS20C01_24840 [marine bacterium B5-7]